MDQLTEIRAALAAAIDAPDLQVSAYPLSAPEPPTAHIIPAAVDYHTNFGSGDDVGEDWSFRVQVFLALVDDLAAQQKADEFLNDGRIRVALEADTTLGGVVSDLIVDRAEFRLWEPGGIPMIGVEYFLRILR